MDLNNKKDYRGLFIGRLYNKLFFWVVPEYGVLSIITCFLVNSIIYFGTQHLLKNAKHYDLTSFIDRSIPFIPQWVIIYVVCYAFWVVNYVMICREDKEKWYKFATADIMSRLICGIFFILLPTQNVRPEVNGTDFCSAVVRWIYAADMPYNLFPSIHCLVSWFCFAGIRKNKKIPLWYKIFSLVAAILVCMSTQFTKQHYFIDIIGGITLAEGCLFISNHTNIYIYLMKVFDKLQYIFFGPERNWDEGRN